MSAQRPQTWGMRDRSEFSAPIHEMVASQSAQMPWVRRMPGGGGGASAWTELHTRNWVTVLVAAHPNG